jgi:plasmid stability protein
MISLQTPAPMATLTIRNLDEGTKAELRIQAARHGRSMEEEARAILRQAVAGSAREPQSASGGVGSRIHAHFARLGGVELELPDRRDPPVGPSFEDVSP